MTADELRALRLKLKLTQKEIAEAVGCKRGAYSLWELGTNPIPEGIELAVQALAIRSSEEAAVIRVRATPGQLRILVELLYDSTRSAELRDTAYQELVRLLGLNQDSS